ncbi:MAG: radical SAM protein [Candidatus Methanomethylophilaceae archaeon]|nr:radical SAM protein [Candidatus Methanomethylophilaceae archaeon]
MEEDLKKKATLTLGGAVRLPEGYQIPVRVSHSTAGPGAGKDSFAFSFGKYRVKKAISYTGGEFELHVRDDGSMFLTHGGEPFIDDIKIEPVVRHCPQQAFFNLDPRCMFHCAYCGSPLLDMNEDKHLSTGRIMEMLEESVTFFDVKAVSFTSGVVGSIDGTVDRMVDVVKAVRSKYPDMPIGVEPYVDSAEQIKALKDAGADEIKINVETPRADIFSRVCPDLDLKGVYERLGEAVEIFGRGNVISNIIYGLGETDEDLAQAMDRLCSMGVIPGLRALRVTDINRESLTSAIGKPEPVSEERAIRLAGLQKDAMLRHGFERMSSHTMCMECGCCDLVPFKDL